VHLSSRVRSIAAYPTAQLAAKKRQLAAEGRKVFDFGAGDPIEPTPAFIREAVGQAVPAISQYPTVKGIPELRRACAGYVERRFGVTLDVESEILPCTGSKEAIYNFAFLFIEPGVKKNVILGPSPGYFVMQRSAVIAGAEYVPVELNEGNGYLLELAALPRELLERTAVAWLNYPHNPTGVECDLAYYRRQVETARHYDIVLASDECYVDVYFGEVPPPSLIEVTRERAVAFHSCSKRSGMTAYRSGFLAGDREILQLYSAFRDTLGVAAPVYTQHAAAKAWADDTHAVERRRIFGEKRELFLSFFQETGLEWTRTNSTFYFWIRTPPGVSDTAYADRLLTRGIVVSPGTNFGPGCGNFIRIALVPSMADCREAISLWREVL